MTIPRKSRRRLCMVVHGSYPPAEPRVTREAAAAVERGYEVDVVAMRRVGEPKQEVVDGVRVIRLPLTHRRGGSFGAVLLEYAAFTILATAAVARLSARRRYAAVHVHNPPDFLIVASLIP